MIEVSDRALRDEYARKAMELFSLDDKEVAMLMRGGFSPRHDIAAKFCFDFAEAMMTERRKRDANRN